MSSAQIRGFCLEANSSVARIKMIAAFASSYMGSVQELAKAAIF
jgi:hypothetical protein